MRQATPGGSYRLSGVAAASRSSAWAVGVAIGSPYQTLMLHWDGHAWARHASPDVGSQANLLNGVAVTGPSDVWAAGQFFNGSVFQNLAVHCC